MLTKWGTLRIGCLGWGSLIWDPRDLPIQRQWFQDGPFAPIEFRRKSRDGRITLVLDPDATPVRLLWAHLLLNDLTAARKALAEREGLTSPNWEKNIGSWQQGEPVPTAILNLSKWADARGLDGVIWTALGPKFDALGLASAGQIVDYLRSLRGGIRDKAEHYVRSAPRQIDTAFRRQIEAALGWSCRDASDHR